MPQTSIAYAVGRIRAQARKPLGEAQMERLLSAASFEEAQRLLSEMGWPEADAADVEGQSIKMLDQVCHLLRDISPEPELTDAFLLRHDAQNLKALFKARILGVSPEGLSACGTLPLDSLRHAVTERVYKKLPPYFAPVMQALEKQTALTVDPMLIDVRIDQALYTEMKRRIAACKSKQAKDYLAAKVDFHNAVAWLRLQSLGQEDLRFSDLLLPGGSIARELWKKLELHKVQLAALFKSYSKPLQEALGRAIKDSKSIPALEKAVDDYLLSLFRPLRNEPFAIEVLLGYLLSHEREAGAVRLIMAGKLNDFPQQVIRERLREAYGR